MKKLITTLFVLALAIGLFAPVTFSVTVQGVSPVPQVAYAATSTDLTWSQIGDCGVVFGSVGNCITYILYFIPFWIGGEVLKMSAWVLDTTASLTLSSQMFTTSSFLGTGWALMRDISNLFFIFILLFIAIKLILGDAHAKDMIWKVVLIAIVINFSMLVTDVIIDTSNTLALVFYNQISVTGDTSSGAKETDALSQVTGNKTGLVAPKQIGLSLASAFHPQAFTDQNFWNGLKDDAGDAKVPAGTMMTVLIVMGMVYIIAAWSFFVAGMSFLGRMVELFLLIIFSPLAFVSIIVPSMRKMEWLGWDDWFSRLLNTAFAAPLYFLMILLIALILKAGLFAGGNAANIQSNLQHNWIVTMVGSVIIPAVFLFIMLTKATEFVKKASGTLGNAIGGVADKAFKGAGGAVLGTAMGGGALIAQGTLGRAGANLKNADWVQNNKTKSGISGWAARQALRTSEAAKTASFDMRQTGLGNALAKKGISLEAPKVLNALPKVLGADLSTAGTAGGREDRRVRFEQWRAEQQKFIGHNVKEKKEIDSVKKEREKAIPKQEDLVKDLEQGHAQNKARIDASAKDLNKAKKEEFNAELGLEKAVNRLADAELKLKEAIAKGDPVEITKATTVRDLAQTAKTAAETKHTSATQAVALAKDNYKNVLIKTKDTREPLEKAQDDLQFLKKGTRPSRDSETGEIKRDSSGKPITSPKLRMTDDHGNRVRHPAKDENGKPHPKAGQLVTKAEVMATMSPEELEKASKGVEKAQFMEFLANETKQRYKGDEVDHAIAHGKDALGNQTSLHFDPKPELRTWRANFVQQGKATGKGAVIGAAAGFLVGGPAGAFVGSIIGGGGAAAVDANKDSRNKRNNTMIDMRQTAIGNVAHGVEEGHPSHEKNPTSTHTGKPLETTLGAAMSEAFGAAAKGGGGGGGHDKPHDDHGSHGGGDHGHDAHGH